MIDEERVEELEEKALEAQDIVDGTDLDEKYKPGFFTIILSRLIDSKTISFLGKAESQVTLLEDDAEEVNETIYEKIDRSPLDKEEYPEPDKLKNTEEKALFALGVVAESWNIPGLSSAHIKEFLEERYNIDHKRTSFSNTLKKLEQNGLARSKVYDERSNARIYILTDQGREEFNKIGGE